MADNLARTAASLSSQLEPVLVGALGAVNRASDFATASQIKNFGEVVRLALKAAEAGLTIEQFRVLADMFKMSHSVFTGGSIEFAAAVSSGLETTEGRTFAVHFTAGGALMGFGLEAGANFATDRRRAAYERSQQNLQLRVDWATVPTPQADALVSQIGEKVLERGFSLDVPVLKDDSQSPVLKAIEEYLPVLKELFKKPE